MPVTNYHTLNGELLGETGPGGRRFYGKDALGSVVATYDQNGTLENTYRYKPYGGLLSKTGSAPDPRFMWTGSTGSRTTGANYAEQYNRTNHYAAPPSAWVSVGPDRSGTGTEAYAVDNPVRFSEAYGSQQRASTEPGFIQMPPAPPCPTLGVGANTYWPSKPGPLDFPVDFDKLDPITIFNGVTYCNYRSKQPFLIMKDNTCCCPCLFLHEYTHIQQISKCCSSTVIRTDIDTNAALGMIHGLFTRGFQLIEPNRSIFECEAYTKQHNCLLSLKKSLIEKQRTGSITKFEKLCIEDGYDSPIEDNIRAAINGRLRFCWGPSGAELVPCPTFPGNLR